MVNSFCAQVHDLFLHPTCNAWPLARIAAGLFKRFDAIPPELAGLR